MRVKYLKLAAFLCTIIFLDSCRNDVYVPGACYNQGIKPIIISNCTTTGCHNAKDHERRLDLTSYSGLMKIVTPGHPLQSDLYSIIRSSGEERMPPDHKLSDNEILLIKSWISLGAAENDCPDVACDSVTVTFSGQVTNLIQKKCIGCHNSGAVILNNYNDVKAQAASGALLGSIKQNGTFKSMPEGYKLSDCEIRIIEKWVNAGAPNN